MFRKPPRWYTLAIKALLFAGVLYKFARLFMKSTERQMKSPSSELFRRRSGKGGRFRLPFIAGNSR
jgi:hypothetical protein